MPSWFTTSEARTFSYTGREKFATVWKTWCEIKDEDSRRRAIYVYGSMGYGKSHILAALACLLIHKGERVIYVPDCRALLHRPVHYLRNAFLLAFADSKSHQTRILQCNDLNAMADYCANYKDRLCFIVDQVNALKPELAGDDNVTKEDKETCRTILTEMQEGHVSIESASANHMTAWRMRAEQTDEQKIRLLGGMTMVRELPSNFSCRDVEPPICFSQKCLSGGRAMPKTSQVSVKWRSTK